MDQTGNSQNQNPMLSKNQIYITIGMIVVIIGIVILANRSPKPAQDDQNQAQDQRTETISGPKEDSGSQSSDATSQDSSTQGKPQAANSNVTASGTLLASDDPTKGNLMLQSPLGKIYIFTVRDFSSLVGRPADLTASGTLQKFVFLSLRAPGTPTDVGGATDEEQQGIKPSEVNFSGNLQNSDNGAKGNYMVVSGMTKVYLKSVHDHSALVGSDVVLKAMGTLNSFTGATVAKK